MKLYDEFFAIIKAFEVNNITYAVIGGAALAFHNKPRFTRAIDILVKQGQLKIVTKLLKHINFFKSTDPHHF